MSRRNPTKKSPRRRHFSSKPMTNLFARTTLSSPSWRGTMLPSKPFERPDSLRSGFDLKRHQQEGVRWLQTCTRIQDRRGVLLADDMGVGKTLQILSFLAWCIESGRFP